MLRIGGATLGISWTIAACASNDAPTPSTGGSSVVPVDSVVTPAPAPPASSAPTPRTGERKESKEPPSPPPQDIYDPNTIPKFELVLDAAAIATLSNATETDKEWVHGSFKFGDVTFADVGVRSKGSHTFRTLPKKASLKVKFNKWVKGQKLWGLEELTLNNSVSDPNYLRQRLTYHVFRSMSLPASRANSAQLTINAEDYGLYANVETPDDSFLERTFGKKARTLYEAHTPGTWLPGSDSRWEVDIPAPDAPAGANPDLNLLFQSVAAAKDETLLADLAKHLHTQEWLRFSATEAVTGHYDGYAYGWWGPHNYFLAGDTDGKFTLLPWSTDTSLADGSGVPDASKPQGDVVLTRCSRNATCWDAYKAEVKSVLSVYETLDLVNLAHQWHEQIDVLAKADPKREQTIERYESETNKLYEWLEARPNLVRSQLGL